MIQQIIKFIKTHLETIILTIAIITITTISFNLGRVSVSDKHNAHILISSPGEPNQGQSDPSLSEGEKAINKENNTNPPTREANPLGNIPVVVSKKSKSGVYHYPWCSGAKKMNQENKIEFSSATKAEEAGYRLAGNCNP